MALELASRPADIGDRLREWREEARLSLMDLAVELRVEHKKLAKVSHELIRRYETGSFDIKNPNLAYLMAVSAVLGHNARELSPEIAEVINELKKVLDFKPRPKQPASRTGSRYRETLPGQSAQIVTKHTEVAQVQVRRVAA